MWIGWCCDKYREAGVNRRAVRREERRVLVVDFKAGLDYLIRFQCVIKG